MNKLKEILDQFELDWGYFKLRCHKYLPNGEKLSAGWITEKDVKKYIQMACVDYARSVINIETNPLIELPLSDYIRLESAWDKKHKEMFDRIDQDLLYLKENRDT